MRHSILSSTKSSLSRNFISRTVPFCVALVCAELCWSGISGGLPSAQAQQANQVNQANSALRRGNGRSSTANNQIRQVNNEATEVKNPKLAEMLKTLEKVQEAVNRLQDYTADFEKYELVDGTGPVSQKMKIKHRPEPFSVHIQFLSGSPRAEQVLYQPGWNQNQMMVKVAGIASFLTSNVSLNPLDPKAMEYSRHPISEIGLKGMLDGVMNMWKDDLKYADLQVLYYKDAKLNANSTKTYYAFKTVHPQPRNVPRFKETTLWIDKETLLPVQLLNKGFNPNGGEPVVVEMYKYSNLRTNVGLQAADFDPNRYGF